MFRLTTKEYIYIYEDDNIDEEETKETEEDEQEGVWEDVGDQDDFGEAENFAENLKLLEGKSEKSKDLTVEGIQNILDERNEEEIEDTVEQNDFEGDSEGEEKINVQSSWKNERKHHLVQDNAPNIIQVHFLLRRIIDL